MELFNLRWSLYIFVPLIFHTNGIGYFPLQMMFESKQSCTINASRKSHEKQPGNIHRICPEPFPVEVPQFGIYLKLKPCFDITLAFLFLIPALPLIGLCWLLVRILSPGPGFYSQTRLGFQGRRFRILKIRTMHHNVEKQTGGAKWSTAGDTRIFGFGKFLRKTHLDELPQLFNVLMSQMSLVGPRPERPEIIESLNLVKLVTGYELRLLMKPGVTGLAQLQLPADTDLQSVRNKVAFDVLYLEQQSFWLDLRLVLGTAFKTIGMSHSGIQRFFFLPFVRVTEGLFADRFNKIETQTEQFQMV